MITLARLREYVADPKEFLRQLRALEDNVATAVKKLDGSFLPNFAVTRRETSARVNVGEYAVANTVAAHITLTFPAPSAQNAGRMIAAMFTDAAFTCTIAVVEGTVAGGVSDLLATAGTVYLYLSDGSNWGRVV